MTHKPNEVFNVAPGEAHIERLDGVGELMPDGYYWITFAWNGKLDKMRRDELVFLANMLRSPRTELIHLNGISVDDSFGNLQENIN